MKRILLLSSSFIILNNVTAQTPTLTNQGFENWSSPNSIGIHAPIDYFGVDTLLFTIAPLAGIMGYPIEPVAQIFKDDVVINEGSYSAKLVTKSVGSTFGTIPGILCNAKIGVNLAGGISDNLLEMIQYSGGLTSYGKKIEQINVHVKADDLNEEPGFILVSAFQVQQNEAGQDTSVVIGSGEYEIEVTPDVEGMTEANILIEYNNPLNTAVDTMIITFFSSKFQNDSTYIYHANNTVWIDDISVVYTDGERLSIQDNMLNKVKINTYPNPVKDVLHLELNNDQKEVKARIYNTAGQLVHFKNVQQSQIELSHLPSGNYFLQLLDNKGLVGQAKFVKE